MTKTLAHMSLPDLLAEADRCARSVKSCAAIIRSLVTDLEAAMLEREHVDAAIREWTKREGLS